MRDHYLTLGVSRRATADDLRRAYHTLARQYHPDKNPHDHTHFKHISAAYKVLSDPAQKRCYDLEYDEWKMEEERAREAEWRRRLLEEEQMRVQEARRRAREEEQQRRMQEATRRAREGEQRRPMEGWYHEWRDDGLRGGQQQRDTAMQELLIVGGAVVALGALSLFEHFFSRRRNN